MRQSKPTQCQQNHTVHPYLFPGTPSDPNANPHSTLPYFDHNSDPSPYVNDTLPTHTSTRDFIAQNENH